MSHLPGPRSSPALYCTVCIKISLVVRFAVQQLRSRTVKTHIFLDLNRGNNQVRVTCINGCCIILLVRVHVCNNGNIKKSIRTTRDFRRRISSAGGRCICIVSVRSLIIRMSQKLGFWHRTEHYVISSRKRTLKLTSCSK